MPTVTDKARETVTYVVNVVDPYVPSLAKDAAGYFYSTATSAAQSVTVTASKAVDSANQTATAARNYATSSVQGAVEMGKNVVTGATHTITSMTPDPVLNLINTTMSNANALRQDPVGTVKPYVPDFVVQVGNKTYEVVSNTADSARKTVGETQGFIVTKVNGTVDYITHIPQVEHLVVELKKLVPNKKEEEVVVTEVKSE